MDTKMKEFYDEYFKTKDVELTSYQSDPVCMALMFHKDRNGEPDYVLPTVNLGSDIGNGTIMPKYCAFLDTNNNPGIDEYLHEAKLAEPYTRFGSVVTAQSGWCEYPLYKFNKEALKKVVPENEIQTYEEGYDKAFKNIQRQMNMDMFGFDPFAEGSENDDFDDDYE